MTVLCHPLQNVPNTVCTPIKILQNKYCLAQFGCTYTLCVCCCSCLNSKYTERTSVFRAVGIHCNFNRYVPLISICSEGGKRVLHAISMIDFMVPIYPKVIEHRMSCRVWRAKNVPLFRGAKKGEPVCSETMFSFLLAIVMDMYSGCLWLRIHLTACDCALSYARKLQNCRLSGFLPTYDGKLSVCALHVNMCCGLVGFFLPSLYALNNGRGHATSRK